MKARVLILAVTPVIGIFLFTYRFAYVLKPERTQNLKCPLCNQSLSSVAYAKAHSELERKIKQEYEYEVKEKTTSFDKQIKELKERHGRDEKSRQILHEREIADLKKSMENGYAKQVDVLERGYNKMIKDNDARVSTMEKQLKREHEKAIQEKNREQKAFEKRRAAAHKQELAEKAKQIKELHKERAAVTKMARDNAKEEFDVKERKLKNALEEKEIEIKRVNNELDELKISRKQSELSGEAGELDLYSVLTHAFPNDFFRRQKRGTSSGDLIQQIRTPTGSLDTPIVFDNKSAATVTKNDMEKANKYKKIHGTEYVLIVSTNLPKRSVSNGLYGEQNGILLVHPRIVTEVVRQIRDGIIRISKLSNSKKDQQEKQSRLYEYVISSEFSTMLESFYKTNEDMFNLQAKEERYHETLWKDRKSLHTRLQKTINDLSSGIESITQKEVILEER